MFFPKTSTLALDIACTVTLNALPAGAMYMQGYGCLEMTVTQVGEEGGFAVYEFGGGCTPEVAKEWSDDLLEKARQATEDEEIRVCREIEGEVSKDLCFSKNFAAKKRD